MPTIPVEPVDLGPSSDTYAGTGDVEQLLGPLKGRFPAWLDLESYLSPAHAEIVDALAAVYPDGIPDFAGDSLTLVRWAEAKVAAASVLSAIRVGLSDDEARIGDQYRAEAFASIGNGVVGYPTGSTDPVDPDNPITGSVPGRPLVSSFTPVSAFPDPYESVREAMPGETV